MRIGASGGSGLLARNALLLPTTQNVQRLSAALGRDLAAAFREVGIPTRPAIEIQVDGATGHINVSADRPDAAQIEDRLNSDPVLAEKIRTTLAVSSHAQGMQRSLEFQREYLNSDNPEAVVAEYSDLFAAPQSPAISLRFEGTQVAVVSRSEAH